MSKKELRASYPAIATRSDVILPGSVVPLDIGRPRSVAAVDAAMKDSGEIILVAQRNPEVEDPAFDDIYQVGVRAEIAQVNKHGRRRYTVVVRAQERVRIDSLWREDPYLVANVVPFAVEALGAEDVAAAGLLELMRDALIEIISTEADNPGELEENLRQIRSPDELVDLAIAHLELDRDVLTDLLCESNVLARLERIQPEIERLRDVLKLKSDIEGEIFGDDSRTQREKVLRSRMRAIKEELGEGEDDNELDELEERVVEAALSDEARSASARQVRRMRDMSPASAEYNVARTYLEWILDLPWGKRSQEAVDVQAARAILDAEHAGLEKIKKRILEFIAVRKLAPNKHGPILCLAGPPGVGKTSLGRSIATALGREYVRASLGGVRDDAEIRGHRRTYVGALPGRIISGLKKAGTMNPVFVLDEIDKLASDMRGDPASALLEVLDPEQNSEFVDHYIEVPVDLSAVMFLATANNVETIPGPLLDRMEVIYLPGYTSEEKKTIARNHLVPRQQGEHGLSGEQLEITDGAIRELIEHYTRESGVRNLERELASVCRTAAVELAGSRGISSMTIDAEHLGEILGPQKFVVDLADLKPQVGVVTGLAWTPVGGDILFIESRLMPGKGKLRITGQIGDVMSESVAAAFSWVRANAKNLGFSHDIIDDVDVHVHLPQGAIRKDGPSAGVAIAASLTSLLTGRPLRHDAAVTGEITLRGRVLEVGGIKTKVLAAHRAGIKTVVLPERNEKDILEIPQSVRDELEFVLAAKVEEAFAVLFADSAGGDAQAAPPTPPPTASPATAPDQSRID